jgi:hypothetical protein
MARKTASVWPFQAELFDWPKIERTAYGNGLQR